MMCPVRPNKQPTPSAEELFAHEPGSSGPETPADDHVHPADDGWDEALAAAGVAEKLQSASDNAADAAFGYGEQDAKWFA